MFIGTWADGQFMEGKWVSNQGAICPRLRSIRWSRCRAAAGRSGAEANMHGM